MGIDDLVRVIVGQNENFLSILQWAVGSIITLLVIFLTANFFTMRKFRQEEIAKIKQEVITNLKESELNSLKEEMKLELKRSLQKEIGHLKTKISGFEGRFEDMDKYQIENRGLLYNLNAEISFDAGVYNNAYTFYMNSLKHFLDSESFGYVGHILTKIENTVDNLKYKQGSDLASFSDISSRLDSKYDVQVKRIANKLSEVNNL